MAQLESFVYSFVARGTIVLAEYTASEFAGNFRERALICLRELPSSAGGNNKFTYDFDHHSFTFLLENGYAYGVVVPNESVGKQLPIALLENVKTEFRKRYGAGGKADTAVANSLTKEFRLVMKEQIQHVINNADEIDRLQKVRAQVSQVKSVMHDNINKTIERGAELSVITDKADELHNSAQDFKRTAGQIKRKMWWQNTKMKLVVIGIILLLVLIIVLSVCHGFNCSN